MNTFTFPTQAQSLALSSASTRSSGGVSPDGPNPFSRLFSVLRRRWRLPFSCAMLAVLLGAVVGALLPSAYTARALILVAPTPLPTNGAAAVRSEDTGVTIETEIAAIGSRDQLGRLLDRLAAVPGFPADEFGRESKLHRLAHWLRAKALRGSAEEQEAERRRERTLDDLDSHLTISAEPRSRVISVRYTAPSAELAALIANTITSVYIREQTERKRHAIRDDLARLDRQLPEMRAAADSANATVHTYRLNQVVLDPANAEQQEQQAIVLKSKITAAQAALVTADRAKLENTAPSDDPAILAARIQAFQRQLDSLQARLRITQPAVDRLRQLQRDADAKRQIYEDGIVLQQRLRRDKDLVTPDAAVLSAAAPPQKPASADPVLFLPPALVIGLMVGGFAALWRESQDTALRDERTVAETLGVPCFGFMPPAKGDQPSQTPILSAAALRGVYAAAMQVETVRSKGSIVLVTSSISGEESSRLAEDFARYAAQLMPRVLLVELDLRKLAARASAARGAASAAPAKGDGPVAIEGESPVPGTVLTRSSPDMPLDVISVASREHDPLIFLIRHDLVEHLRGLRKDYDCIVIHVAPILETIEASLLADLADRVLLAIRWGHTPRERVENALTILARSGATGAKVGKLGAVLTSVDVRHHCAFGFNDAIDAMVSAHRDRSHA